MSSGRQSSWQVWLVFAVMVGVLFVGYQRLAPLIIQSALDAESKATRKKRLRQTTTPTRKALRTFTATNQGAQLVPLQLPAGPPTFAANGVVSVAVWDEKGVSVQTFGGPPKLRRTPPLANTTWAGTLTPAAGALWTVAGQDPREPGRLLRIDAPFDGAPVAPAEVPADADDLDGNGTQLCFVSGGEVFVLDPTLPALRQVTDTAEVELEPSLDATGERVVFVRGHAVFVVELATGRETRIHAGEVEVRAPAWAGDEVLFYQAAAGEAWDLMRAVPGAEVAPVSGRLILPQHPSAAIATGPTGTWVVHIPTKQNALKLTRLDADGRALIKTKWRLLRHPSLRIDNDRATVAMLGGGQKKATLLIVDVSPALTEDGPPSR